MRVSFAIGLVIAFSVGAVHAQSPTPSPSTGVTAFVNVAVVPMDAERVLIGQTVLVERGKITGLGPVGRVPIPTKALRVEGQGKYLIPGLADMHSHLTTDIVKAEGVLFAYVASGVTTIRVLDWDNRQAGEANLALRARVATGKLLGPQVYTSGLWGERSPQTGLRETTKPEDVAGQIATYKAAGYDFVKIHGDINVATPQGRAVYDSLVAASRREKLPIVGHVENGLTLAHALATVYSIEHQIGYGYPTVNMTGRWDSTGVAELRTLGADGQPDLAKIRALAVATQRAGVWNCPTLPVGTESPVRKPLVKALQDAGAGLLLGLDFGDARYGVKAVNGIRVGITDELEAFVKVGLTPYQALATSTRNVAQYFGTLDKTGTVAVGKRADLVLVNGNPLVDVKNATQAAGVMVGGQWLDRPALDAHIRALGGKTE